MNQPDLACLTVHANVPDTFHYVTVIFIFQPLSAIAAKVIKVRTLDEQHSFIQIKVIKVFKRGKLHIHDYRDTNLWVKSSCVCPKLKKNRKYFITGYEDVTLNRLVYTPTSLVARWNTRLESKLKVWSLLEHVPHK